MPERRRLLRQGLDAVLRRTLAEEEEPRPPTKRREPKAHTSVYLYPDEFEMLEELIFRLRREHGVRIKKSDLWRALLHMAMAMLNDSERVSVLLSACKSLEP